MVEYFDYALILIAFYLMYRAPTVEMMLLFLYFTASCAVTLMLVQTESFDRLGTNWFMLYSIWMLIFAAATRILQVAVLFCAQQVICLIVVLQWNTDQVMLYNSYSYIIAIIYLKQLGCAYGRYHPRGIDRRSGRGFYMAHNEAWQ